jgi:TonB family protein
MKQIFSFFFCLCVSVSVFGQEPDAVLDVAEVQPLYGACAGKTKIEITACSEAEVVKFLSRNLEYPAVAREAGIQGVVVVQFIVKKDGSTTDHRILRDIGAKCGEEALRVVKMMHTWKPGLQSGKAANVRMTLPIRFRLETEVANEIDYTLYCGTSTSDQMNRSELVQALKTAPTVRDAAGNSLKIHSLTLTIEVKRKPKSITVTDAMPNKAMISLAKKSRNGSTAILEAKVMKDGKYMTTQRQWTVIAD